MSKIVEFKPRKPPPQPAEDLPHYHSIVCELSELTPKDRLSVIAASCPERITPNSSSSRPTRSGRGQLTSSKR